MKSFENLVCIYLHIVNACGLKKLAKNSSFTLKKFSSDISSSNGRTEKLEGAADHRVYIKIEDNFKNTLPKPFCLLHIGNLCIKFPGLLIITKVEPLVSAFLATEEWPT